MNMDPGSLGRKGFTVEIQGKGYLQATLLRRLLGPRKQRPSYFSIWEEGHGKGTVLLKRQAFFANRHQTRPMLLNKTFLDLHSVFRQWNAAMVDHRKQKWTIRILEAGLEVTFSRQFLSFPQPKGMHVHDEAKFLIDTVYTVNILHKWIVWLRRHILMEIHNNCVRYLLIDALK